MHKGVVALTLAAVASRALSETLTWAGGATASGDFAAAAAWEGPVAVNKGGRLVLGGSANLSPSATLTVSAGGTVEVAAGVKVSVAALVVGGQKLPAGVYSAATHPEAFAGAGRVRSGMPGAVILVR